MKHISLFLLFVFLKGITIAQTSYDLVKLESMIEAARKEWNVPGVAVGVVHNDKVLFAKGFGNCTDGKNETVNEKTQFGIASNTKAFTAMAIAILVKEGKLKFEDKVTDHLPWFKMYNDYVTKEMTVRDLLTHHSGLQTFSGDLIWYASTHSREEIVKRSQHLKPLYGFREKFGYSNIHFLAAGLIVEKLSGMSYDDFLKERIFSPLKMTGTNTSIRNNPSTNVASPHAQKNGTNIPIPYVNWDNIAPAGSINSNVNDMCRWLRTLLKSGKHETGAIIDEANFSKLIQPVTATPVSKFSMKMHPSKHLAAYGMGFNLFDYHGALVINHSGGLDGMISHLVFVPEKNFGFVILSNAGTGLPGVMIYDILDFMMEKQPENYASKYHELIKSNAENEKKEEIKKWKDAYPGKKPPLDPEAFVGRYSGNVYGSASVEENKGQLSFKMDHSPIFHADLHYWKDNAFYFDFPDVPSLPRGTVTFTIDEKTKLVSEMVIDCPNPDFYFTELDLIKERK